MGPWLRLKHLVRCLELGIYARVLLKSILYVFSFFFFWNIVRALEIAPNIRETVWNARDRNAETRRGAENAFAFFLQQTAATVFHENQNGIRSSNNTRKSLRRGGRKNAMKRTPLLSIGTFGYQILV